VECALKACISKRTREHDFPGKKLVNHRHTHDIVKLITLAFDRFPQSGPLANPIYRSP